MQTVTQQESILGFNDLIDPSLAERTDADGATVRLDPSQEAAFDVVLDVDARGLDARGWRSLAAHALRPQFNQALAALCVARAAEADRIEGARNGR